MKINEKSWIFTISQLEGFLGNLGVYLIHPPKLCAGLTLPVHLHDETSLDRLVRF